MFVVFLLVFLISLTEWNKGLRQIGLSSNFKDSYVIRKDPWCKSLEGFVIGTSHDYNKREAEILDSFLWLNFDSWSDSRSGCGCGTGMVLVITCRCCMNIVSVYCSSWLSCIPITAKLKQRLRM